MTSSAKGGGSTGASEESASSCGTEASRLNGIEGGAPSGSSVVGSVPGREDVVDVVVVDVVDDELDVVEFDGELDEPRWRISVGSVAPSPQPPGPFGLPMEKH